MKLIVRLILFSLSILLAGSAASPTPTPSASCLRKIVYTSTGDQEIFEIMVMNSDGTDIRNISNNIADDLDPTWSPDGKQIAFASDRANRSSLDTQIYSMNEDGSNVVQLTMGLGSSRHPAWSPDGKQVAFDYKFTDTQAEIYLMNIDGTGSKRLINSSSMNQSPAWSPDGKKIAYSSAVWNEKQKKFINYDIYIMNADGSNPRKMTTSLADDYSPVWSPDGKKIAFTSDRRGDADIFVMNVSTIKVQQLTLNSHSSDEYPSWSPDGRTIVFNSNRDNSGGEIYVMDANGQHAVRLTNSTQHHMTWQPVWSPLCN